ncbi:MAG: protein kinase [Desulfobulbaceae bacterium]|nr:protein kinase [Desulfobulbaceae bacterium]
MTEITKNFPDPTYLLEEGITINGKWKILNFIAKGGKGEVYLAHQLRLDRQVALKIISQEFIKTLEEDAEEISSEIKRFHREVLVMARLQHPNILQVYDFDQLEIDGMELDYIVMEYVPGPTLRQKMSDEGFGHDQNKVKKWLKDYFFPILEGMKAVHDKGVVHRDLKPENVLIDDGRPKIMDFGIAGGYHFNDVTQSHHMIGTITYMPEEQFMDLALTDARVDIYALGKILYEMIEGKIKIGRKNAFESVALNGPQNNFFKALNRVIKQATAKDRNQRTPSVKVLQDSLVELVMDSEKKQTSPLGFLDKYWKHLIGFSTALTIILVGFILLHESTNLSLILNKEKDHNQPAVSNPIDFSLTLAEFKTPRPTLIPDIETMEELPESISASDDMTMILLTGTEVFIPADASMIDKEEQIKETISVKTIYMDKTKITNHLYVQFLHELEGIEVKNKSVFWKGQIMLFLGETLKDYEPITFNEGIFRAKPDFATNPVVRVTPFGALAYAHYYGRSLPTSEQWLLAVQADGYPTSPETIPSVLSPEKLTMGTGIQPVIHTTANRVGIQGLRQNVHEWTFILGAEGAPQFYVHGLDNTESYLERQLSEAFANVGFRTVLNLDKKK